MRTSGRATYGGKRPASAWLISPLGLFPLAFFVYFGLGSINVFPYRGEVSWRTVAYAGLGLGFYLLGALLALKIAHRGIASTLPAGAGRARPKHLRRVVACGLACGGIASVGTMVSFGGVPLAAGETRLQASATLMSLAYLAVLASCLAGTAALLQQSPKLGWTVVALVTPSLLLLGFRTLPLAIGLTLLLTAIWVGRLRIDLRVVAAGLVGILALAWIAVLRFGAGPGAYFRMLRDQGMPGWFAPVAPLWITVREGVGVLNTLIAAVPGSRPHQQGDMFMSSFITVMPGEQQSARGIVGDLVDARPGITITPSILGQPYVDFGVFGIAVEMMLLGGGLAILYVWSVRARTWMPMVLYAFCLSTALMSIHSGLLDPIVFASVGLLIAYSLYSERSAGPKRPEESRMSRPRISSERRVE